MIITFGKTDDSDIKVRCKLKPSECCIAKKCIVTCGFYSYVSWTYYLINKDHLEVIE